MAFKRQSGILAQNRRRKAKKYEGVVRYSSERYRKNLIADKNAVAMSS